MKKFFGSVLILCAIFLLSACGKTGKEMVVNLKGNPTTGYEWTAQISNPEVLNQKSDEYTPDEHEEDMVGTGGTYEFVFTGLKEGATDIIFRYARSFEDAEPTYMITYQVEVDSEGLIKVVSATGNYSEEELPEPILK